MWKLAASSKKCASVVQRGSTYFAHQIPVVWDQKTSGIYYSGDYSGEVGKTWFRGWKPHGVGTAYVTDMNREWDCFGFTCEGNWDKGRPTGEMKMTVWHSNEEHGRDTRGTFTVHFENGEPLADTLKFAEVATEGPVELSVSKTDWAKRALQSCAQPLWLVQSQAVPSHAIDAPNKQSACQHMIKSFKRA